MVSPLPGTSGTRAGSFHQSDGHPPPLESIPLANERIDDIDFDGGVVLDVLNVSPAYDRGETEGQVKDRWRRYWRKLWEDVEK